MFGELQEYLGEGAVVIHRRGAESTEFSQRYFFAFLAPLAGAIDFVRSIERFNRKDAKARGNARKFHRRGAESTEV